MDVVSGSTTSISLTMGFNELTACYGTTVAQWNNTTRNITLAGNVLPPVVAGDPPCVLSGTINVPALQIL